MHGPQMVATEEPALVNDLVQFLTAVAELAGEPTAVLSRESAAFAFPQAEQVGLRLISSTIDKAQWDAIEKYIAQLSEAAQSLLDGRIPSDASLAMLRQFLERMAELSLEQVDDRQIRSEAGTSERRSLIEWQKTSTG